MDYIMVDVEKLSSKSEGHYLPCLINIGDISLHSWDRTLHNVGKRNRRVVNPLRSMLMALQIHIAYEDIYRLIQSYHEKLSYMS